MKREELLAKGYTEEQVTDILNTLHSVSKDKDAPFFVAIGLSMCNTEHDSFNKKIGRELAIARAEEYWKKYTFKNRQISKYETVETVKTEIQNFFSSCVRYYKNKSIITPKFVLID